MSYKSLEKKFNKLLDHNKKFGNWENQLNELLESGNMAKIKMFEMVNNTQIDWNTLWIMAAISTFTKTNNETIFEQTLNDAISHNIITGFEKKKVGYQISDNSHESIRFVKLTEFFPNLSDKTKNILFSSERAGHCHWNSIHLSEGISQPHKLVSGYCSSMQSKKMHYPHSWLEIEHNNKEWALDFSTNLAMHKDGYYKLFAPENTVEIDNETLKEDLKLRSQTSFEDKDIRMYLFFPNEARAEMQSESSQTLSE